MYTLIIILIVVLPLIAAFLISLVVYKRLLKTTLKYPRLYQAITFLFSLVIIMGGLFFLALYNIRIER